MLQHTSAFPPLLSPSPVNVTLQQLGRRVGVWGNGVGECQGFLCQAGVRSRQNRRQQTSAYLLVYADELVVISYPSSSLSLLPSVVGVETCSSEVVWVG